MPLSTRTDREPDGTDERPAKSTGVPGKTTGRVVMSSCSLRKVTTEPENETEPTRSVNSEADQRERRPPVLQELEERRRSPPRRRRRR